MKKRIDDITKINFSSRAIMRYDTAGDWFDSGTIEVFNGLTKVEKLAVGIHELVEMVLLHLQGVTERQVTKWDTEDTNGAYDPNMYSKDERYKLAHEYAESVEKKIVEQAGLDWETYNSKLMTTKVVYDDHHKKQLAYKEILRRKKDFLTTKDIKIIYGIDKHQIIRKIKNKEFKGAFKNSVGEWEIPINEIKEYIEYMNKIKKNYIPLKDFAKIIGMSANRVNVYFRLDVIRGTISFDNKNYINKNYINKYVKRKKEGKHLFLSKDRGLYRKRFYSKGKEHFEGRFKTIEQLEKASKLKQNETS